MPQTTVLPPAQEQAYRQWMDKIGHTRDRGYRVDENFNGQDYDYRGYFQENGPVDLAQGEHLTDTYKLPNHETFSAESKYAKGEDAARAGHWQGDTFVPPGTEIYSVSQEAIDADSIAQQGVEIFTVDKAALPELVNGKPAQAQIEGIGERVAAGVEKSAHSMVAADLADDAVTFFDQAKRARSMLAYGRNAFGIAYGPEDRAKLQADADQNTKWYIESVADSIAAQAKVQSLPSSSARAQLAAVGTQGESNLEQLSQIADAVAQDPLGLLTDVTAENSLQMAGTIISVMAARGAGAGRIGEMAAGYNSSQFNEFGAEYVNLRAQGLSHEEAWEKAGTKAGVVALFDMASFGVTGKAVDKMLRQTLAKKVVAGARGVAEDAIMGMGGEAWSQLLENGTAKPVNLGDLFAEGFGELAGAPMQMAAQFPGREAELNAAPAAEPMAEPADVSGEDVCGRVAPEIVGTVDIDAAGEPTLDAGMAEEQIPPSNVAADTDSLSTAVTAEPAGEVELPPGTPTQGEIGAEAPPPEGVRATSQRSAVADTPAGKESDSSPAPGLNDQQRADLETSRGDIGWNEQGGRLLRDEHGNVTGRTSWIGSELWRSRPTKGGALTEKEANVAVDKAQKGGKLTAREQRFVDHVLATREEERALQVDASDFREALLDPKQDRDFAELVQQAHRYADTEEVERALEATDDEAAIRRLHELIDRGKASGNAQAEPAADETNAPSPETKGQTAETPRPVDLFGVDVERQSQLNRESQRVARKLGEGRTSPPAERAPRGDIFREATEAERAAVKAAQSSIDDQPAAGDQEVWRVPRTVYLRGVNHSEELMTALGNTHKLEVAEALQAGKDVPNDVLRDYPDLRKYADDLKKGAKPLRTPMQQQVNDLQRAIDKQAHEAATSPTNDLPEPTQAQKDAGNYAKGHVRVHGLDISIENPAGSVRRSKPGASRPWEVTMQHHYGYIRGTVGKDKDHIDVFLGPNAEDENLPVFVYDQPKFDGTGFDEHKVVIGARSPMEAHRVYSSSYSDDARRMTDRATSEEWSLEEFKRWLAEGDHNKPAREFTKVLNVTRPTGNAATVSAVRKLTQLTQGAPERIQQAIDSGASDTDLIEIASQAAWGGSFGGATFEGGHVEGRNTTVTVVNADGEQKLSGKKLAAAIRAAYKPVRTLSTPRSDTSTTSKASPNRVFTEDAAAKARALLKTKLSSPQSGVDPEILQAGITLAGYHIERGARTFAAYTQAMLADLGDAVRPYLRAWYEAVRFYPGFDAAGMDSGEAISASTTPPLTQPTESDRATPAAKPQAKPEVAPTGTKQDQALARFRKLLDSNTPMRDFRAAYSEIVGAKEGALTKRVDELVELAIVQKAREIVRTAGSPQQVYDALVALYGRQPNLGVRTSTSVEQQAYSTPAPLAYLAANLAHVTDLSSVNEPTAGNGMLLISANPKRTWANELNPARVDALRSQGFDATQVNALQRVVPPTMDVVLANPPFGAVVENGFSKTFKETWPDSTPWAGTNIDYAISIKALASMKPGGRAVLIVGGVAKTVKSKEARADAYNGSAKRKFYYGLYRNYRVIDHFTVAGELYEKQGAGWPVDVIVIDGRSASARALPAVDVPRV
jgi:hypothetical protein